MRFSRLLQIVLMTVPTACVSPSSPPPAPAPSPPVPMQVATQPVALQATSDVPTEGRWSYRQDARGSIALFGAPGRDALFVLRCDRERRIFASVAGTVTGSIRFRAMTAAKAIPTMSTGQNPDYSASEIARDDPLLDALAYSRGTFRVEFAAIVLTIPAWPEFARVVEDCRG